MKSAVLILSLMFVVWSDWIHASDWPTWRGPNGDGKLAVDESVAYPIQWSESENLRWKVPLPGPGNSSPIVVSGRVYLTQGTDGGLARSLICFSAKDGARLWEQTVPYPKKDRTHKTNPYCSASPTSDGNSIYVWHGNAGFYAYSLDGKLLWQRDLGSDYEHIWGPNAASPVVFGDHVIVHAGPGLAARLFSLNKQTGEVTWRKDLPQAVSEKGAEQFKGSWATPLLIDNDGRSEVLVGLPGKLTSFDPVTGGEFWHCSGLSDLCYTNVLADKKHAIYLCGYGGPGMAMRLPAVPSELGDITASHQLWADQGKKPNRQRIGSGLLMGKDLFVLDEPGIAVCLDVLTGQKRWEQRLSRRSWSSMNLVGKYIYVNDQSGTTFVIDPDANELKTVAVNKLSGNEHTNSSLAFSDGVVYLRTDKFLRAFAE